MFGYLSLQQSHKERLHCCYSKQLNWMFNKQQEQEIWLEWQQNTANGKFPTISSRSWEKRRASIDWTPCVVVEPPQQMFFLAGFTALFILDCSFMRWRSKAQGGQHVMRGRGREGRWFFFWLLGQRALGLMKKEHRVTGSCLFTQSYSSEWKVNFGFQIPLLLTNAVPHSSAATEFIWTCSSGGQTPVYKINMKSCWR